MSWVSCLAVCVTQMPDAANALNFFSTARLTNGIIFMKRLNTGLLLAAAVCVAAVCHAQPAPQLRVLVHNSYALPKPLIAQFEADTGAKVSIIKAGDAGEMLNKLILTRATPIADVVYGIDNSLQLKAHAAGVLEFYAGPARQRKTVPVLGAASSALGAHIVPVNYGYVTINLDKAGFAKTGLPVPKHLEDLTLPAYRGLLSVQNPATSSTGNAFLLATIAGLGETAAFEWWAKMRGNGLKVAKGWSEAYYSDFSRNGGRYPLVVSYASSPAAEVFYSKIKLSQPPTDSLNLKGAVFQQVEGAALIKGTEQAKLAGQFIEFLRSQAVQEALQTSMWMLAVEPSAAKSPAWRFAPEPSQHFTPSAAEMATKNGDWVTRWTKVVLK